jgi:hypothetical protein
MKKYIKRLLREGLNKVDIEDFYKKHNIDSEELSWLGSGVVVILVMPMRLKIVV